MTGISTNSENLELDVAQIATLRMVQALSLTLTAFDSKIAHSIYTSSTSALVTIANAALKNTMCPFGAPAADIVTEFDSSRNIYFRCCHGDPPGRHCWDGSLRSIDCPA